MTGMLVMAIAREKTTITAPRLCASPISDDASTRRSDSTPTVNGMATPITVTNPTTRASLRENSARISAPEQNIRSNRPS